MIKIRTTIKRSIFILLLCNFCISAKIRVDLRVLDSDGHELEQVQAGKPFVLDVSVKDARSSISDPHIEGVEAFSVRRSGYRMNLINNQSTINYTFVTRIDKPGSYSIGPAIVQDRDERAQSSVLILKVGKSEIAYGDNRQNKKTKKIFLQLATDKKQVVAGEKIKGTITLYCSVPDVSLHSIKEPKLDGFVRMDKGAPQQGVQVIDGQKYSYVMWNWRCFAKQPGQFVVPACSADISMPPEGDFYSQFSSFFNVRSHRKRVHSNALTIAVDPLPPHTGLVDAVGQFQNFSASVNQAVAREGDGIVLTLALEGDADLEHLQLEPQDLPHIFKSYSSKQYISDDKMAKKSFEFIIQGMEPGEWEIPEQKFTYYDVAKDAYKELKTSPLMIKILSGTTRKKYVPPVPDDPSLATAIDAGSSVGGGNLVLDTYGNWYEISERKMPDWLFLLLFLAPLGIWASRLLRRAFRRYLMWHAPRTQWKNAFKIAHNKLQQAKKRNDYSALYRVMVDLFAVRCSVKHAQVSDALTKSVLQVGGLSEEQLRDWDHFFAQISSFVFYKTKAGDVDKALFDQADAWVGVLEKVL